MFRALVLLPLARRALITEVNLKGGVNKTKGKKNKKNNKIPELLMDDVSQEPGADDWPPDWLQLGPVGLEF